MKKVNDSQASGAVNPHDPNAQADAVKQDSLSTGVHELPAEAVPAASDNKPEDFGKAIDLDAEGKGSDALKPVKKNKK